MTRVLGFFFACAALAWLGYFGLRLGVADLRQVEARSLIASWRDTPRPSTEAWSRARKRLLDAKALNTSNGSISEDLARLYIRRALASQSLNMVRLANMRQGLDYLRQSAAARPASPYPWAGIALAKARLGEFDAEYSRAHDNSRLLGPWEPEVTAALNEAQSLRAQTRSR